MSQHPLAESIEDIEVAYEYMLAYAAQGRKTDIGENSVPIREYLTKMTGALDVIYKYLKDQQNQGAFIKAVMEDLMIAKDIVELTLKKKNISSQCIDNVNASVHVRTMITDLFILEDLESE